MSVSKGKNSHTVVMLIQFVADGHLGT